MGERRRRRAAAVATIAFAALLASGCDRLRSPEREVSRAREALTAGDAPSAVIHLKNALEREPKQVGARLLLVDASLAVADVAGARAELDRAVQLGAPVAELLPRQLAVLTAERGFDALLREAMSAGAAGLPPVVRERARGVALAGLGRPGEAVEAFRAALAADPQDPEALAGLVAALGASGAPQEALALAEQNSGRAAEPPIGIALGEARVAAGNIAAAGQAFAAAFKGASARRSMRSFLSAGLGLAETQLAQGDLKGAAATLAGLRRGAPNAVVTRLIEARVALAEGRLADAAAAANAVVKAVPGDPQARMLLAIVNLQQGNLQQAESHLHRVLTDRPAFAPARRLLAEMQLRAGRTDDAKQTLAPLASGAADAATLALLGQATAAGGDRATARSYFDRALRAPDATDSLKLQLAAQLFTGGEADRATAVLDSLSAGVGTATAKRADLLRAVAGAQGQPPATARAALDAVAAKYADDSNVQETVALFLAARGDFDGARARLEPVLKRTPIEPEAFAALARVEAAARRPEAADAALRKLLAAKPKDIGALMGLAEIAAARGDVAAARQHLEAARAADPKALAPRLVLARLAAAEGDAERARAVMREALAIAPGKPEVLALAGAVELRAGNVPEAERLTGKGTEAAPASAAAWLARGQVELAAHHLEAARASLEKALAIEPGLLSAAGALAGLEFSAGNANQALVVARRLQGAPGRKASGLALEGDVRMQMRAFGEAATLYERALKAEPAGAYAVRAYEARQQGKLPEPTAPLSAWLAAHPDDAQVRAAFAEALAARGERKGAIREYEQGLMTAPGQPLLLNNLAWLYFVDGDPKALPTARQAVARSAGQPLILDTLGWILVQQGELKEGLEILERAALGAPGNPEVQYHTAYALAKAGNSARARELLKNALASREPFESRSAAERLAAKL